MSRVLLACLWLVSTGCAETQPSPARRIGLFHHEGRNLELRADGRFRLTVKGCVFLTVDVKGRWEPRGSTSVLRADGSTPIPWDMFRVVDQIDVSTDEGKGIVVAAIPRVAPEVAKAADGAGLPPELEPKPDDPFGPW